MNVRLLVLDVDGTLLNPAGQLTSKVVAAVRAAAATGCVVTLATGRRFRSAKPIADALGLELPILVQNGALIRDSLTGEVLYHRHLTRQAADVALRSMWEAEAQPIVYENAFTGERLFTGPAVRDNRTNRTYFQRNAELVRRGTLSDLLAGEPPLEVAILDDEDQVAALAPQLVHSGFRVLATTNASGDGAFLEVLEVGCSKAEALQELVRRFDVSLAATMAIGDNLNDLELLTAVGVSVAMGNGHPRVKAAAQFITASNTEDGVAEAIAQHVLHRSAASVLDRAW